MDVLILLVFVSLMLVVGGLLLLFVGIKDGDYEHGDRLSLLPLEEDASPAPDVVQREVSVKRSMSGPTWAEVQGE